MGIVNMLRFDSHSGAMICDEESTYFMRRRTHFDENIRNLVSEEISDKFNIEAVYGGAGYPPFHFEVVRKAIQSIEAEAGEVSKLSVEDVARITLKDMQKTIRRKVDDKLKLFYGFNMDELNQGFFERGEEKIEIVQESVKKTARDISTFSDKSLPMQNIFKNQSAVMGYDPRFGFQAYRLEGSITVMSFLTGFESVGKGKYGAGMSFARTYNKKFLSERREGFAPVEGMILLLASAIVARSYFIDIGGYFQLVYINGRGKNRRERFLSPDPHKIKLAEEITVTYLKGLLERETAETLIRQLIFENASLDDIEDELFNSSEDPDLMEYILRGYKMDPENLRPLEKEMIEIYPNGTEPFISINTNKSTPMPQEEQK